MNGITSTHKKRYPVLYIFQNSIKHHGVFDEYPKTICMEKSENMYASVPISSELLTNGQVSLHMNLYHSLGKFSRQQIIDHIFLIFSENRL